MVRLHRYRQRPSIILQPSRGPAASLRQRLSHPAWTRLTQQLRGGLISLVLVIMGLGSLIDPSRADTAPRHLIVALPAGLSPRTIGFYLAQQNGYFAERGLTVDFISSATQSPSRLLADGKADLAVDLMASALHLHQTGTAIQHVAQFFQHSSLALYCRPPITKTADLHGTTIGVWFGGEESSFYAWMANLNISTFGEEDGVTVLRQGRVSEALADARLDCVTSTSYLAPLQMQASGIAPGSRTVFRYDELGVGTLEDGLYARTRDLDDTARIDVFDRFLIASIRGWQKLHDDRLAGLKLLRVHGGAAVDQADHPPEALSSNGSSGGGDSTGETGSKTNATTAAGSDAAAVGQTKSAGTIHQGTNNKDNAGGDKISGDKASGSSSAAGNSAMDNALDVAALKASLDAVDALIDPNRYRIGLLDSDSYDRTINLLLTGAPEPVLKGAPEEAVSDVLWKHLHQVSGVAKP